MNADIRTFVYGSETVALDSLRAAGDSFRLSRFVSRQSVISGVSRPLILEGVGDSGPVSSRAKEDASSSLMMWARLDRAGTDLLLWDLSDERFGVDSYGNDVYRSATPDYAEFRDQLQQFAAPQHIAFGSDEHFELFQLAASRFVALLNSVELGSRTLVLAPEFATHFVGESAPVDHFDSDKLNFQWRRYWKFLHDVCGLPVVVLPSSSTRADADHRWGAAPFHFAPETHAILAESISEFAKRLPVSGRALRSVVLREAFDSLPEVSLERFLDAPLVDGVHRVRAHGTDVHLLLNFDGRQNVERVPVFFSGALSPGQKVGGPIFSGREMCRSLGLPFIAIADPSIGIVPPTELAWYAGSEWHDTQRVVAEILAGLETRLCKPLLLVGGSGGGFAALEQVARAARSSKIAALVWNPQLDISGYGSAAVDKFLASSYPSAYLEFGSGNGLLALQAIRRRFDVNFEVYESTQEGRMSRALLLQQRDDWHFDHFLRPFGECLGVEIPDEGPWVGVNDVAGFSGTWGVGHVPPPRELLERLILDASTSAVSMAELARSVGQEEAEVGVVS